MLELASAAQIALDATIGFMVGLGVGLVASSTFTVVRKRDYDRLTREHEYRQFDRDYSSDRGDK